MIDQLKQWDTQLFLFLNSKHNAFFDVIMYWASDKLFWVPLYVFLAIVVIRCFKKRSVLVLLCIALLITASDQVASHFLKNTVRRLRPSHEAALQGYIHLSKAGAGGLYGFVSSHASNSFALFVFLAIVFPASYRTLKFVLFFWALLVGYSRIYNGVHYPGDVIGGAVCGAILAWLFSQLYFYANRKWNDEKIRS